jgi:hypothetical protein
VQADAPKDALLLRLTEAGTGVADLAEHVEDVVARPSERRRVVAARRRCWPAANALDWVQVGFDGEDVDEDLDLPAWTGCSEFLRA